MKINQSLVLAAVVVSLAVSMARAENLTLFSAKDAGANAWSWGGARVKKAGSDMRIMEKDPEADFGDAFLSDRFPYIPKGEITLDIKETDGTYALQILCFKGDQYIDSVDLTKNSAEAGEQTFTLQGYRIPEGTEMITFKMWIGGEGASARIRDLTYTVPISPESVVLDKEINETTVCKAHQVRWSSTSDGGTIRLESGQKNGSALFPDRVPVFQSKLLILDVPKIQNGTVTVQLPVFDSTGTYLSSVNAIEKTGAGFSSIRLDSLEWPAQADQFEIQVWLGGTPDAEAVVRRILVLK